MTNQTTTNQLPPPPLDVSAAISQAIYHTICQTSHQHPELVATKYRSTPWHLVKSTFLRKMQASLANFSTPQAMEKRIGQILHIFLEPQFFLSSQAVEIQTKINSLIPVDLVPIDLVPIVDKLDAINQLNLARRNDSRKSSNFSNSSNSSNNQGIAILLLDVENLQLDTATEKFLAEVCQYPIQIKIAFANWRHMGKQDLEFHQRGYELIHVPAGKDSADVKLATVGSSIFVHYPTAKEVLVCSSDAVLTHLCTTLQTHGLGVYLVRKKGEILTALDMKTGNTYTRMLRISTDINSPAQLISQIQKIIKAEQQLIGKNWIQLSRVSQLFRSKYHLTISQAVSIHLPGQKARDILLGNPEIFVVHRSTKEKNLYVSLFDCFSVGSQSRTSVGSQDHISIGSQNRSRTASQNISLVSQESTRIIASSNGTNGISNGIINGSKALHGLSANPTDNDYKDLPSLFSTPFSSKADLELVLVKLIKEITQNDQSQSVYVGVLGNQFSRRYGRKITDVVKSLKLASTFSLFLESSPLFHLNKTESQVTVSLA